MEAVAVEGLAQRALLDGDAGRAREGFRRAADLYRLSWPVAPPRSFGRLIGMLKAAVIGGGGESEALYARNSIGARADSPPSGYALAIAGLVLGDDDLARAGAEVMRRGDDRFRRTADAIAAILDRDAGAYSAAVQAIVTSFEERDTHLTGVPIADTAVMLEILAGARGLTADAESPLLPLAG
jgi:hypothetical protein